MEKTYCKDCGGATEYSLKKPNFCNNCGNSFGKPRPVGSKGARGVRGKISSPPPVLEEDEEITTIPQLDELEVEISSIGRAKGIKLEDLWRSVDTENPDLSGPTTIISNDEMGGAEQTREQFMEEFRAEAGTLRKDIPNRGD